MKLTEKELRDAVYEIMVEASEQKEPDIVLSKKGKEIKEYLKKTSFGCSRDAVVGLVSLIIGETIPLKEDLFNKGTCVVPTKNPNSHNYDINVACVIVGDNTAVKKDNETGNYLPDEKNAVRVATKEEIRDFADTADIGAIRRIYIL